MRARCHSIKNAAILAAALLFCCAMHAQPVSAVTANRADWMKKARWGIMTHFLADWRAQVDGEKMTVDRWNALIDSYDVEGIANQLRSVGAGYYLISIGQNSGYYLSPNSTYDRLTGIQPTKCSRRDLVAALSEALEKRGIRLLVYLPSGAPAGDATALRALEWSNGGHRNLEFQLKWEQVIREWSQRWGTNVAGWWFDGCYWPNAMYRTVEPPNFKSFAAAARSGNPQSVIAFNPGVFGRLFSMAPEEDYTAGEVNEPGSVVVRRAGDGKVDGAQLHVLSYLGSTWGKGSPRFDNDEAAGFTRNLSGKGVVVTWDAPALKNGLLSEPFLEQLRAIGQAMRKE